MTTLLSFGLVGCAGAIRAKAIKTAAFEHSCPEEQIKVVSEHLDILAYELDVCGKKRKYRDMGNEKEFQFVDVTDGSSTAKVPSR